MSNMQSSLHLDYQNYKHEKTETDHTLKELIEWKGNNNQAIIVIRDLGTKDNEE